MLISKASLFAKIGHPERGFSVALRAASISFKAGLLPDLWRAVGALGGILNAVGEFGASRRLLDAVLPQALEHGDLALCADLYACQADAWMGLAGLEDENTSLGQRQRAVKINKAESYIDRARECEFTLPLSPPIPPNPNSPSIFPSLPCIPLTNPF